MRTFETDFELVNFLADYGIEMEDAYELIDRYDAPVPASLTGVNIFHEDDRLHLHLHKQAVHLFLSESEEAKWCIEVQNRS